MTQQQIATESGARRPRRWWSGSTLAFCAVLALAAALLVEALCQRALRQRAIDIHEEQTALFIDDPVLGYRAKGAAKVQTFKSQAGRELYTCTYTFDPLGRRVTPPDANNGVHFAVFFGGGFVFGEGLKDDETLPFHFAKAAPQFMAYNYGYRGYGPQHMLARVETGKLRDQLQRPMGVFVYVLTHEQIERAAGKWMTFDNWEAPAPQYALVDSALINKGIMESARPEEGFVRSVLDKSATLRLMGLTPAPSPTPDDIALTAAMLDSSRDQLLARFPKSKFVVLLHPDTQFVDGIIPALEAQTLTYLDYHEMFKRTQALYWLEDGYPSALASMAVAKQLARDIGPIMLKYE